MLLEDQDRRRWDAEAIARATRLAARALRLGPPGRYVLQAAIAVEHANAPTPPPPAGTTSPRSTTASAALSPDPVVELNRAVAIAMAGDLTGGLARIDALGPALDRYHYFHAARADLLRRLDGAGRRRGGLRACTRAGRQHRRARVPRAAAGPGDRLRMFAA